MQTVKVNHAVVGVAIGRLLNNIFKSVKKGGSVAIYNGVSQSNVGTVDAPVSSAIFHDVRINGFDYSSWAANDKAGFSSAVSNVAKLIEEKKVSLTATVLPLSEHHKAVDAVAKSGSFVVFKL